MSVTAAAAPQSVGDHEIHMPAHKIHEAVDNTLITHLGIEYLDSEDGLLRARMPVDARTRQPGGVLHGGASMVLAESLGSTASHLLINPEKQYCLGLEINGNHLRAVKAGWVTGICHPVHIGKTTHVWDIRIKDDKHRLVCISRLTVAVRKHRPD